MNYRNIQYTLDLKADKKSLNYMQISGRIIEEQKSYFTVDTTEGAFRASIRGILKKDRVRICTGDLVNIEITSQSPPEAIITSVHPRSSYLRRPAVANLSQIFFINTLFSPSLDLEALDRFLFNAEAYHLKPYIVFNKIDLLDSDEIEELEKISTLYRNIGYRIIWTSALSGKGIEEILELCANQLSVFAGLSGVGKSTLLSTIFPSKQFRIGDVSGATGRGTHTTTSISLIPLDENGYLADTPGISFVDLPQVSEEDVATYFPELYSNIGQCRFNNCIHDGEPGCIVMQMVEEQKIAKSRHSHYLKIYYEMKEVRKRYR